MNQIVMEIKLNVKLDLTEGEARALSAICGYGPDEFKKWFYRNLGKAYLMQHDENLDTLFVKARNLDSQLRQIDEYKKAINKIIQKR